MTDELPVLLWMSTICPRNLTGTDFPSVGGGGHMNASTSPTPLPERARKTHHSCASTPAACGGRSATLAAPTGARHPWLAAPSVDGDDAAPPLAALAAGACGRHVTPPADIQTLINSSSSLPPPRALRKAAYRAATPWGAVSPRPSATARGRSAGNAHARGRARALRDLPPPGAGNSDGRTGGAARTEGGGVEGLRGARFAARLLVLLAP